MKIHIIYNNFLSPDGNKMSIGGIQTYIINLIAVLRKLEYDIIIHQVSNSDFHKIFESYQVYGYYLPIDRQTNSKLIKKAKDHIDVTRDLVIFGCETCAVERLPCKTIGIQHGVFWDKPEYQGCNNLMYFYVFIKKMIKSWRTIKRLSNISEVVCVDYNFINWYRSLVAYPRVKMTVIPNFCELPQFVPIKPTTCVNIIFARRFYPYRGTRLLTEALFMIIKEHPNVNLIIAGEGPDESFLKMSFSNIASSVRFIKYDSADSLAIHKDMHIALIPTLGSEGTSLSLLEAMAAGCVPICTNVGGMTNVILDHYNGIMISPDVESLYGAIKEVVENEKLREQLSKNAYNTACASFGLYRWQNAWQKVINKAVNRYEE